MKKPAKFTKVGAVFVAALMAFPVVVDARGRAGGGGISRGGPASSGGFSSQAVNTSAFAGDAGIAARGLPSGTAGQPRDIGSARDARSTGGVNSSMGAGQPRDASSSVGVGSSAVVTRPSGISGAAAVRDASPEDMAKYRAQFNRDNTAAAGEDDRWDRPRPVDPDYSVPVRAPGTVIPPGTVAAGAVVGTAIARENAVDYVAGGTGDYYTELPCSVQGNADVDGSRYYKCSNAWYKRVYNGDDVVYVQVDAPPGM